MKDRSVGAIAFNILNVLFSDVCSPKAPLYDMNRHDDRILAVDWSVPEVMLSAGADNKLHIFNYSTASLETSDWHWRTALFGCCTHLQLQPLLISKCWISWAGHKINIHIFVLPCVTSVIFGLWKCAQHCLQWNLKQQAKVVWKERWSPVRRSFTLKNEGQAFRNSGPERRVASHQGFLCFNNSLLRKGKQLQRQERQRTSTITGYADHCIYASSSSSRLWSTQFGAKMGICTLDTN